MRNYILWSKFAIIILLFIFFICGNYADERALSLESRVLESFEDSDTGEDCLDRWIIKGSKFVKKYVDLEDNQEKEDIRLIKVNTWPEALHGKNLKKYPYYCLGLRTSFTRKGYNYIEIIPAREFDPEVDFREYIEGKDDPNSIVDSLTKCNKQYVLDRNNIIYTDQKGKEWVSNPIVFEGRAQAMSVWVWGSNFNYYFEAHLEDHRGVVHVLPFGDLLFNGWKNLTVDIPASIPQAEKYIPRLRRLKLKKFMLWTRPTERISGFYIYIDQVKILTDLYETRYDGDELEDPEELQKIWGECY